MSTTSGSRNSLTLRSLSASLLVISISGIIGQLSGVLDSANTLIGTEALPVPALLAFFPFALVLASIAALSRTRILDRGELIVVLVSALIATPLMTVGFWRYQLAGLSGAVRASDWVKLEATPEGLWPHGENLLEHALEPGVRGVERLAGVAQAGAGIALENTDPGGVSRVRLKFALGPELTGISGGASASLVPGRPYLLTGRVKARALAPDARYFVRTYADDSALVAAELVSQASETKPAPLFPDGSARVGYYPVELPSAARRAVTFELGLSGKGRVEWQDLKLYDARAIELAYKGFSRVDEGQWRTLSLAQRQGTLIVPDRLLSVAGLRYVAGLDYPLADWLAPVSRLASLTLLVFGATFALGLFYRKQWLENERYAAPLLKPLLALLGVSEAEGGLGPRFFRSGWLWGGFLTALAWCTLRVLHGYVPSLPDPSISINLKGYLSDAGWGRTWDDVKLEVYPLLLALGLLMDLKVLLSLVLGFLACRLQYAAGQTYGWASDTNFPHFSHQMLGAYLAYALLTLLLTRRYIASAVRSAFGRGAVGSEARAQRSALVLLALCGAGLVLWAHWVGITLVAATVLGLHLVLFGFVAAKLRAECGLPRGGFNHPLGALGVYNVPVEPLLFVPLLGGLSAFGGGGIATMTLVTSSLLPYGFFLVPGLQVEALELGRRLGLRTSHVAAATLLGVAGGIVIGGWIYLTAMYGFGASKFYDTAQFSDRLAAFRAFNAELASAKSAMSGAPTAVTSAADQARHAALAFGAAATAIITLLRQNFPGFWFHPIGLLVGPSDAMQIAWGSLLAAWVARFTVLRLGGAASVREKLIPAAVGIFVASLCGHALYIAGNAYWFFFNKGAVKFTGLL